MKNKQFELEYTIRSSPSILYNFLSSTSGLSQWFADEVKSRDNKYFFTWDGSEEMAEVIEQTDNEFIKFRWEYSPPDEYFAFQIQKSEVTNDTILIITDFAPEDEVSDQKMLWDSQVSVLIRQIGGA